MKSNRIFAKSFNRYENKKFRYWAITGIGFFVLSLSFFTLLKHSFGPLPICGVVIERKQICNVSDPKFDVCDVEGDIRIDLKSSTIFAASSQMFDMVGNESWTVKPYPRKNDHYLMGFIKQFSVNATVGHEESPSCTLNHSVPAIVFSIGGYGSGNHWHAFTDILIPLFEASAQFHGEVQFLITNIEDIHWIMKYQAILKQLSRYEIVKIDSDDNVHCFPRVIVGLKYYKDFRIDPLTASKGYSMKEFRKVMRDAYSLNRSVAIKIGHDTQEKPRLLILTRKGSREFMNVDEIVELAKSMGFEVVVSEAMANMDKFSHIVNSCDVMMGIHGAGLTNIVFLPTNAVLIQVLPWGTFEWLASNCFGKPALDMDLRYMEYKVKEEESSLIQQYPLDHPIFKDSHPNQKVDWGLFKTVYLKQNVKIDVGRFKATLSKALKHLHR
ncbi:alpha-1,3-arabinosyltransferase XAT3-like isoform X2 [Macadamia integrifolia]|uniref:alpha-1,3-arabinosyltransferase XAT3-like isoform X2 n=1 Tax=Macadamia integrifolia TaxID=60698 RepID=UPI001C527E4A|nr:alpha-1,3-arabinosyltransferase XAT3-like isoform X2 [Macadamia integrifolia]